MTVLELIAKQSQFFDLRPKDAYVLWVGPETARLMANKMLDMDIRNGKAADGPLYYEDRYIQQIMRSEVSLFGYKVKFSQDEPGFRFERAVPR